MRYTEGKVGRIFVVRLEDGDKLPEAIESFARKNNVFRAMCILVGGIREGGNIVVGPKDGESMPVVPMIFGLKGIHEICAVGTIFPGTDGKPRLHMHAALGREGKTRSGCIRPGIEVWKLGEAIVLEIKENTAHRKDNATGFSMLEP